MTEKKTAKKNKPSLSKKKMSELEKALCSLPAQDKVLILHVDESEYELHIKPYLSFAEKDELMNHVREMYFPNGIYDKNAGDMALEFILFQMYTGLTFGSDIQGFDHFIHSDAWQHEIGYGDHLYYSNDYYEIKDAVQSMVEAMLNEKEFSLYREEFYRNFNELFLALHSLLDKADGSLSDMVDSIKSEDGVVVKDLLDALTQMDKKDEKKIVSAILDFQEAKAKRQAVSVEVPHL